MPGAERKFILWALKWVTVTALSASFFAVSLWQMEAWNRRAAIATLHESGIVTAMSYSMLLQSEIEKQRLVPLILAYDPDVIAALSVPQPTAPSPASSLRAARAALNRKFTLLSKDTAAGVIYLLDANGTAVAASDWNQPTSFLGHNFAFRPYYSRARAAGTGEYFALGAVNHLPGLFLSQRVEVNGQFLGVLVVKVAFQRLENAWAQSGARVLVANRNGIVLVTDVADWQFKTIAPLPEELRASLRMKARYGAAALTPMPFDVADAHQLVVTGDKRFVAVTAQVPITHWTIYFLAPFDRSLGEYQTYLSAGLLTALVVGLAFIIRARLQHRVSVRAKADEMRRLATTDSLTQLLNRRGFESILDQEWRRASRAGTSLAAMMVDVDYFKLFNDFYGHLAGDECLRMIAGVLRNSIKRSGDAVARWGGEEFILLLPCTDLAGATRVAETMLKATRALEIRHEKAPHTGYVTISIGVASFVVSDSVSATRLISAADKALYEAKRTGRDRFAMVNADG